MYLGKERDLETFNGGPEMGISAHSLQIPSQSYWRKVQECLTFSVTSLGKKAQHKWGHLGRWCWDSTGRTD